MLVNSLHVDPLFPVVARDAEAGQFILAVAGGGNASPRPNPILPEHFIVHKADASLITGGVLGVCRLNRAAAKWLLGI
jgi:hypothetical protein